jgi:uncharacterized OB-fold protein
VGRFRVQLETTGGTPAPRKTGLDDKLRRRDRHLMLCQSCEQYIYPSEPFCPHCDAPNRRQATADDKLKLEISTLLEEIELNNRRIVEIAERAGEA